MNRILFFIFTLSSFILSAQKNDSIKDTNIEEVKITSIKNKIDPKKTSFFTKQISNKEIEFQNPQTTAEMLQNTGNVFVQKSQQGGGSPVLRGFESSRVLLLVDGVRMNNLIFRAGHLQNVITVDENMLSDTFVYFGPTSSLFGSDALGGSINMVTKNSALNSGWKGNFITRYGSVNNEKSGFLDIGYGAKNWSSYTAFSYNDFGDLKMGRQKNRNGDFFGERFIYQGFENGVDVVLQNENKYKQVASGYQQYNFLQKLMYVSKKGYQHSLNFQYATSSNINRYDRLSETTNNGNSLRFAEWYYGPQERLLSVYSLEKKNFFKNTNVKLDVSYQKVQESRFQRRFSNYNVQNRIEDVDVFSANFNFLTTLKKGKLYYGFENYLETLNSFAYSRNINTGEISSLDSRYPDGKNTMLRNELYVFYSSNLYKKTNWNAGLRVGKTNLKSDIDNNLLNLPITSLRQDNWAYSGNIGIVHNASENFTVKSNLSSGYRVPNIDDLAKIFEISDTRIIIPNSDLQPEKTITSDFGILLNSKDKRFNFDATYYYTWFFDALVTDKTSLNGAETIPYNGNTVEVFSTQNLRRAFVTGVNFSVLIKPLRNIEFDANFNTTLGRIIEKGNRIPLDHIPPQFGKIGFKVVPKWATFEAFMMFNSKKDLSEYLLNSEDNEQYAPEGGMPAWETYNLKFSTQVFEGLTFYSGVENLLDTQFRMFASGINAPGRNIYGGAKYSF